MNFHGPLRQEIGAFKKIKARGEKISLSELMDIIAMHDWGIKLVEGNHIRPSVILLMDGELVKVSSTPDKQIKESSKLDFMVMFAGG